MKPRHAPLVALAAMALSLPVAAQSVRDCDGFEANARNLVFPLDRSTASYANGDIRLIMLDTAEPACCSFHLMVLYPDPEIGHGLCALVSDRGQSGFGGIDLTGRTASYDPATGLSVRMPVRRYDGMAFRETAVTVTVNQQTGRVTAQ